MKGWQNFTKLMLEAAKEIMEPSFKNHSEELGETLLNRLHNTKGPTVIDRPLNKNEKFFGRIFQGFNELFKSFEALKDIEIYIASFPYKNKNINKIRYLRYNIENYFHEIYILKERLISYAKIIDRSYKKDINHVNIKDNIKLLVENSLEKIVNIRGKHVHKFRFESNSLERLELMNLLALSDQEPLHIIISNYYKITFNQTRNEWKRTIVNNNRELVKLLDIYSDSITRTLFNEQTGKINYPNE
jgi:hypothetical protein